MFFEHPLDAHRLAVVGSTTVLVVALGVVAWPRSSDDIPTHLPFITIPPSTITTPTEVVVHVAGSVFRPGLYHRPPGDRVADFLDGVRIWVPSVEEPLDPLPTPGIGNGPVGLNRATAVQLQSLTGVGPSLVAAISPEVVTTLGERFPGVGLWASPRFDRRTLTTAGHGDPGGGESW